MGDSRFSEAVYVFLTTRVGRVIMGDSKFSEAVLYFRPLE